MSNDRIKRLKQQRAALDKKLREAENAERKKARDDDTRRCIIAGRYARIHAEKNPDSDFAKTLQRLLNEYVTRKGDRILLSLPPLEEGSSNENEQLRSEFDKTQDNPIPEN